MAPGLLYPPGDDPSFTALCSPDISKELRGGKRRVAQACAPHTPQGPLKAMMPLPQASSGSLHLGDGMEQRR